jgi:glutamine---fructose-6-phosphate transaminase (isomerizing)
VAELHPELFAADVLDQPRALALTASLYAGGGPLTQLTGSRLRGRRLVFIGMGSSRFAAMDAAAVLRNQGVDAYAETASTGLPQPPSRDTVAVAISATGGSEETVAGMRHHLGTSLVVGVTGRSDSPVAIEADVCLPLPAGDGASGVACASYRSTVAVLHLLCGLVLGDPGVSAARVDAAAAASAEVLERRSEWLAPAVELLAGGAVHVLAPAERAGSAEQSALMLREVPRIAAHACETGDWSHVGVYLTRRPGYRALVLPGSRYEAEVMEWAAERGFTVVVAGGAIPGAALDIELPGVADPIVRSLVETHVAELVAAELWARDPI